MHSGLLGFPRNAQFPSHFWLPKGVSRPWLEKTREGAVSVADFGAVPGQVGAARKNAAAFMAAMAHPVVYVPAGDWYVENVFVPSTCRHIFGPGKLIAAGSPVAFNGLLHLENISETVTEGVTVNVDTTTFPNVDGIRLLNCQKCAVRGVTAQGAAGIVGIGCNKTLVRDCVVDAYKVIGISFDNSAVTHIIDNKVSGGAVGSVHAISIGAGTECVIMGNWTLGAKIFGISVSANSGDGPVLFAVIVGNTCLNSVKEGISVGNIQHFIIANNILQFDGTSEDFGLSVAGDVTFVPASTAQFGVVIGNYIIEPSKEGIALTDGGKEVLVTGNFIRSPCQGEVGAAILISGSRSTSNSVIGNFILDFTGNVTHQVAEENIVGIPNDNILGPNYGAPGTVTMYGVLGSNSEPAWKAFTPVITAGAGAFTTVSATCRYRIDGKTLRFNMTITITTNGTAAGSVIATLPFAAHATHAAIAAGRNDVNGGAMLQGNVGGSNVTIRKYDNGYPGSDGEIMRLSGAYEMA